MIIAAVLGGALAGFLTGAYIATRIAEEAMTKMEKGFYALIQGLLEGVASMEH